MFDVDQQVPPANTEFQDARFRDARCDLAGKKESVLPAVASSAPPELAGIEGGKVVIAKLKSDWAPVQSQTPKSSWVMLDWILRDLGKDFEEIYSSAVPDLVARRVFWPSNTFAVSKGHSRRVHCP